MWRCVWMVMPVLTLLFSAGCGGSSYEGPPRVAVEGTVTLDGQPLPSGNIIFVGDAGALRQADGTIADGKFTIPEEFGPNAGNYKVRIVSYSRSGPESTGEVGVEETDELSGSSEQLIPAQYNDQTTLTAEIAPGMEPLAFDLTK